MASVGKRSRSFKSFAEEDYGLEVEEDFLAEEVPGGGGGGVMARPSRLAARGAAAAAAAGGCGLHAYMH